MLREALQYYATPGAGPPRFLDLLAELPAGSPRAKAGGHGGGPGQTLRAAMINDPLFGGAGAPLDPEVLLTPARRLREPGSR